MWQLIFLLWLWFHPLPPVRDVLPEHLSDIQAQMLAPSPINPPFGAPFGMVMVIDNIDYFLNFDGERFQLFDMQGSEAQIVLIRYLVKNYLKGLPWWKRWPLLGWVYIKLAVRWFIDALLGK